MCSNWRLTSCSLRRRAGTTIVAMIALFAAACGTTDGGSGTPVPTMTGTRGATATSTVPPPATSTRTENPAGTATHTVAPPNTPTGTAVQPTPTGTAAQPTQTTTPASGLVSGLVVLHQDVAAAEGDSLGVPPDAWMDEAKNSTFDRGLAYADWLLDGDAARGVTGADGHFEITGLAPGAHSLQVTKTLEGNLISFTVPFTVGDDGRSTVVAEVKWGLVRASPTYTKDGDVVQDVLGPYGSRVSVRDTKIAALGDPATTIVDPDGDGSFGMEPCGDAFWSCDVKPACEQGRVCACTASCPGCEDCGPGICVPPGSPNPYRCNDDDSCDNPGDECVCVSSCPGCDDCARQACVSRCAPVDIVALTVGGSAELIVGQPGALYAAAVLSNGTQIDATHLVEWTSSDPNVLTVDSWGAVTALTVGSVTVGATLGSLHSEPWPITVTERPALRRIVVRNLNCYCGPTILARPGPDGAPFAPCLDDQPPPRADLLPVPICHRVVRIGATIQFVAIGEFGEGAFYEDLSTTVTWDVAPPAIGKISGGVFTAVAAGTAAVSASLGAVTSESLEVRVVTEPTVVSLSIYPDNVAYDAVRGGPLPGDQSVTQPCFECGYSLTILKGDTVRFSATAQYDTGDWEEVTDRVTWRSGNAAVATVDEEGSVTAVAGGGARIDATLDEVTSNPVDVRVVNEATLQNISIYQEGITRVVGKADQAFLHASGYYDVGFERDVTGSATWRSSNDSVGGFDTAGVFTGRSAGSVEVWAELDGLQSNRHVLEVYETSDIDYCDAAAVNRGVWSDDFNRVVLESDCSEYTPPGVATLRYTVTETKPHGGIFDPCLDLYVYRGETRVRTLREEGCGDPFLPTGAPEYDDAVLKYQLRAFWDLKDEAGQAVAPGTYTVFGRFYLYYDPVVRIDVTVK